MGVQVDRAASARGAHALTPPRGRHHLWVWVVVVVLAVAAAVASILLSRWLFPHFTANNDEPGYVYQARMLLAGRLTLPAAEYEEFFRPWISGRIGDQLVPVFPPVWPAVLAAAEAVAGSMRVAAALTAAGLVVLVFLFALQLTGDRVGAGVAAALFMASPFFLIQTATLLSYPFALLVQLAFGLCLLAAVRTGRAGWAVGAGFLAGLAAFARSYDAVLFALPMAVAALAGLWRDPRRLGRTVLWAAVGALPVLGVLVAYNLAVTGEPLSFALQAAAPGNRFGFGPRNIAQGTPPVDYSLREAVRSLVYTTLSLPGWVFGSLMAVPLAILGFFAIPHRANAWLLAGLAVAFPLGYLFWWGNALATLGVTLFGPQYFLPTLVPVVILTAAGLLEVLRRRRTAGVLIVCALLAATVVRLPERLAINREISAAQVAEVAAVEAAVDGAAVVILPTEGDGPWIGHPKPQLLNDVGLANEVLYATDREGRNLALADRFPDRGLYRLSWRLPAPGAAEPVPVVHPLEVLRAPRVTAASTITNTTGQRVVSVFATDGVRVSQYVVDEESRLGATYAVDWELSSEGVRPAANLRPLSEDFAPAAEGQVAIGVAIGPTAELGAGEVFEQRLWYRGGDELELLAPGSEWHGATAQGPWTPRPVNDTFSLTLPGTAA